MTPQTDTANTNNWLEATRGNVICPYIENYAPTSSIQGMPLSTANHYDALKRVSVPYLGGFGANAEARLGMEFQDWDDLSDEALMNFEMELD